MAALLMLVVTTVLATRQAFTMILKRAISIVTVIAVVWWSLGVSPMGVMFHPDDVGSRISSQWKLPVIHNISGAICTLEDAKSS